MHRLLKGVISRRSLLAAALVGGGALVGCTDARARSGIYVQTLGGGAPGWIAPPDGGPVWSPDGMRLAWCGESGLSIWLGDKETPLLLPDHAVGLPAWSPDGSKIAFAGLRDSVLRVVSVADMTEAAAVPLATGDAALSIRAAVTIGSPAWSPDGRTIAFTCQDGAGDEICLVNSNGNGRRQLTALGPRAGSAAHTEEAQLAMSNAGLPAWAPDGRAIAVAVFAEVTGATAGVYIVQTRPMRSRAITRSVPNSALVWSSDGSAIMFSTDRSGSSDLWHVPVSSLPTDLATNVIAQDARDPATSANGSVLAYERQGAVVVTSAGEIVETIELPGLRVDAPALNPVDNRIAFRASEDPIPSYRWDS